MSCCLDFILVEGNITGTCSQKGKLGMDCCLSIYLYLHLCSVHHTCWQEAKGFFSVSFSSLRKELLVEVGIKLVSFMELVFIIVGFSPNHQ